MTNDKGFSTRFSLHYYQSGGADFPVHSLLPKKLENCQTKWKVLPIPYNTSKSRLDGKFPSLSSNTGKNQKPRMKVEISFVSPSTDSRRILPAGQQKKQQIFSDLLLFGGGGYSVVCCGVICQNCIWRLRSIAFLWCSSLCPGLPVHWQEKNNR